MKMGNPNQIDLRLSPSTAAALRARAQETHDGNVSRLVTELVETACAQRTFRTQARTVKISIYLADTTLAQLPCDLAPTAVVREVIERAV